MGPSPLGFFLDVVKEQYYPLDNYEDWYMRWTTLRQEKSQTVSKFTNTFHAFHTNMGIKDFKRNLVLKYCGALHRYIQIEIDFLDISSLGVLIDMFSKSRKNLVTRTNGNSGL